MIRVLLLLPLVACAMPQPDCGAQTTRALGTIQSLIAQTEANIARGYAIEQRADTILYTQTCPSSDGTVANSFCDRLQPVTERIHVAIELEAERTKLRDLKLKEAALKSQAHTTARKCGGIEARS